MNVNWIIGFTLFSFMFFVFWMKARRIATHRYNVAVDGPFVHSVLMAIPAIIAIVIFNNSRFLVEYFNVNYFCAYSSNLDIYSWIFPKIISRCHEFFRFGIHDQYARGLVIILDFFFVSCFIFYFPIFWIVEKKTYEGFKARISHENPYFTRIRPFATIVIFFFVFMYVFVWSVALVDRGYSHGYAALLSDYGIGAAIQAVVPTVGPYSFLRTITVLRILRERAGSGVARQDHHMD